jgi:hypothetical protein
MVALHSYAGTLGPHAGCSATPRFLYRNAHRLVRAMRPHF